MTRASALALLAGATLTAQTPDLWILTGPSAGLAQMLRRLAVSTDWRAESTPLLDVVVAADAVRLAGPDASEGLRGVDGEGWRWVAHEGALHPAGQREPTARR